MTDNHTGEGAQADKTPPEKTPPEKTPPESSTLSETPYQKQVEDLRKEVEDLRKEVRSNKSSYLEKGQYIATMLGVPIAILAMVSTFLAFIAAAYSFTYSGEMQAEDAANRALQDHMQLRAELDDEASEQLLTMRDSPEQLDDSNEVSDSEFAKYDSVADHGIATAEWIYRTRVMREPVEGFGPFEYALSKLGLRETEKDEGWEDSLESWLWEYRAAIYARDRAYEDEGEDEYSNFGCFGWNPDFIHFVRRSLADRELAEGNWFRRTFDDREMQEAHVERAVDVWTYLCRDWG